MPQARKEQFATLGSSTGDVLEVDSDGYFVFLPNRVDVYDAIVDAAGNGDFLLISTAFAAGHSHIYVRDGNYVETANIVMSSGSSITGETGSVIDLSGGFQILIEGTGNQINTGTISVTTDSAAVVGVGTTFSSLAAGDFIRIGARFHEILSITDNTNLTLELTYRGNTLSGLSFLAQTMVSGVQIENIIVTGATASAINIIRTRQIILNDIRVEESGDGSLLSAIFYTDCGEGMATSVSVLNSNAGGAVNVTSTSSLMFDSCEFSHSVGDGFETNSSDGIALDNCLITQNGARGVDLRNSTRVHVTDCIISENDLVGILTDTTTTANVIGCTSSKNQVGANPTGPNNIFDGCIIEDNLSSGLLFSGDNGIVTSCQINNNAGDGIDLTGDNCRLGSNICTGNTGTGINIDSIANNAFAAYNHLSDNGTNFIDDGSETVIIGKVTDGYDLSIALGDAFDMSDGGNILVTAATAAIGTGGGITLGSGSGAVGDGDINFDIANSVRDGYVRFQQDGIDFLTLRGDVPSNAAFFPVGDFIINGDAIVTGKLTVDGYLDPTALINEQAPPPPTTATQGALFVSDGDQGLVADTLYFRQASDGTITAVAGAGGGGGGALDATLTLGATSGADATTSGNNIVMSGDGSDQDDIKIGGTGGLAFALDFSSASTTTGAALNITGQTGASTGGAINVLAGAGGSAGTGGIVNVTGGTVTDGDGGIINITGSDGVGTNRSGGQINITGGASTNANAGGNIMLDGGTSPGVDGYIGFSNGGVSTLAIVDGVGAVPSSPGILFDVARTTIAIAHGQTTGDLSTHLFVIQGKRSDDDAGGPIEFRGGPGTNAAGGSATLVGGLVGGTGTGGTVNVTAGAGGTTAGTGGVVNITGGTPVDGDGGAVNMTGSAGVGTNRNGSDITIQTGEGDGAGIDGYMHLNLQTAATLPSGRILFEENGTPFVTFDPNTLTSFTGDVSIAGKLTVDGLIDPTGMVFVEQASVPGGTPASGEATLWIRSSDGYAIVTDDTGSDTVLSGGGVGGGGETLSATLVLGATSGANATTSGNDIVMSGDGSDQDDIKIGGTGGLAFALDFSSTSATTGAAVGITGQTGASTATGGAINVTGGTGGATSGVGGAIGLTGGPGTGTGAGGDVVITSGTGSPVGTIPLAVGATTVATVSAVAISGSLPGILYNVSNAFSGISHGSAAGDLSGNTLGVIGSTSTDNDGGNVTVNGGAGGTAGDGGNATLAGGAGAGAGVGGDAILNAGTGGTLGAAIILQQGGTEGGRFFTDSGGDTILQFEQDTDPVIRLQARTSGAAASTFNIRGQDNFASGGFAGGDVDITAGTGDGSTGGGDIFVVGGTPGTTGIGGAVSITASTGGVTSGAGGDITITSGGASNSSSAGNINLLTAAASTGASGDINLTLNNSSSGADGYVRLLNNNGEFLNIGVSGDDALFTPINDLIILGNATVTGKLTVDGYLDPTALINEQAPPPPTTATQGALFVSDGTQSLTADTLYFRQASDGSMTAIAGAGAAGSGTLAETLVLGNTTSGNSINFTAGDNLISIGTDGTAFQMEFDATSATTGGAVNITSQDGGAASAGGAVTITSGTGGSSDGTGGAIIITGGIGGVTNGDGGGFAAAAGASSGAGDGGEADLTGGAGGTTGGGGDAEVTGGAGGSASGAAGGVNLRGGTPISGAGGAVTVTGSSGVGGASAGGAVTITSGTSIGATNGADITLDTGGSGSGTSGSTIFSHDSATTLAVVSGVGAIPTSPGILFDAARTTVAITHGQTTGDLSTHLFAIQGKRSDDDAGGPIEVRGGPGTGAAGGNASLLGGSVGGTAIGGSANVTGGAGGATAGNGGIVNITGGAVTDGDGGIINITGSDGVGTNRSGGQINITGGASTNANSGGRIILDGGNSASGVDGYIAFNHGSAPTLVVASSVGAVPSSPGILFDASKTTVAIAHAQTTGNLSAHTFVIQGKRSDDDAGGPIELRGGPGTDAAAGSATLVGGATGGTGVGGGVVVRSGAGGTTSGDSGSVTIESGTPTSGSGGDIILTVADSVASNFSGGNFGFTAGAGTGTGDGGGYTFDAGFSGAGATGNGGAFTLTAGGSLATDGNGGSIVLDAGERAGGGNDGYIEMQLGGNDLVIIGGSGGTRPTVGNIRIAHDLIPSIYTRNNADSADHRLISRNASDETVIGDGSDGLVIGTTTITSFIATHEWDSTVVAPVFNQATSSATDNGQTLTINAQDVSDNAAAIAGPLTIRAGNTTGAGSISHIGGDVTFNAGDPSGATSATNRGGDVTIRGGNATAGGANLGGNTIIAGGTGATTDGYVAIQVSDATIVTVTDAASGSEPGLLFNAATTDVSIAHGSATGDQSGSSLAIRGLTSTDEAGGFVNVLGGDAGLTATIGGTASIAGGNGTVSGAIGGIGAVSGGTGSGTGGGGLAVVNGGTPGATGDAGSVIIQGGAAVAGDGGNLSMLGSAGVGTSKTGGTVTITAGNSTNAIPGANITLAPGTSATGIDGYININTGDDTAVIQIGGGSGAETLGFYTNIPIIQPSSTGETVGFTAGGGTAVNDESTFTGNVGSTAYRVSDIVKHLKDLGLIAS